MSELKPKKIFISYAHEDINTALSIYNDLKRYGLDVWIDCHDLKAGQRWKDKIEDTIEESAYFLFLLSSQSLNKRGFVQRELNYALEILKECPADHEYIIPIRLDDCEPKNRILRNIQWVDLFPESEYQNGLKKILQVVSPGTFNIRHEANEISSADVNEMIKMHGYYDRDRNPEGKGIEHEYELNDVNGDKVIIDIATGLMWQQSGSIDYISFEYAKKWVMDLNQRNFAGFSDWRIPTLEETMSLMQPKKENGLYINPIFSNKQAYIWTIDSVKGDNLAWILYLNDGYCYSTLYGANAVRAVRSV